MFHQTRIQLTAWYLTIIMIISIMFSLGIYRILGNELNRMEHQRRLRYTQVESDWRLPQGLRNYLLDRLDPQVIDESKKRLAFQLSLINGGIFLAASLAGYFLAGRTLKPISDMVKDQKRFVADASHELKTPLTSLRSEIEVGLRDEKLSLKEAKSILKSNLEEVIRLQTLSAGLLLLSKNGSANNQTYFSDISLKDLLEEALDKLQPLIKKKNLLLKKNVEEVNIRGIPDRITELFVILIDNAIKYSNEEGSVFINIKKANNTAAISIKDQGIGIDKKDLSHIFERFYRADSSRTKDSSSGFGLGLSIAKRIVKNHNGVISVKSRVGEGSEFIIKLPI